MRIFLNFLIIILLSSYSSFSQKECKDYLAKNCDEYGDPFKISGQSKAGLFEKGQKSMYSVTVYDGFEYRVSICRDKKLEGLFFRIRENDVNKTILYDSSTEDEDYLEKFFAVEESRILFIEVVIPESEDETESEDYKKRFGCVGLLIEYTRQKSLGFE